MDAETAGLLREYAAGLAEDHGLPADYVLAHLDVESSGGRNTADSSAGAIGPMQLMPATAKRLGVDARDPMQNIQGGVAELARLRDQFGGDLLKASAGYNSNPDKVEQRMAQGLDGLPPETQNYLFKIAKGYPALLDAPAPAKAPGPGQPVPAPSVAPGGPQPPSTMAADVGGFDALGRAAGIVGRGALAAGGNLVHGLAADADTLATGGQQVASKLTGGLVPPVPASQLPSLPEAGAAALDVANLLVPSASRIGAATIGGAAALLHSIANGEPWNTTAAATVGATILGGLFPGAKSPIGEAEAAVGVARPGPAAFRASTQDARAAAQNKALGEATIAKFTDTTLADLRHTDANQLIDTKIATLADKKNAAYSKIDRGADVDVTDYVNVLQDHKANGRTLPSTIAEGTKGFYAELKPQQLPDGTWAILPTGRMRGTVGNLLDANMKLGERINEVAASADRAGIRDLKTLRKDLTNTTAAALPNAGQRTLFAAARSSAKQAAQDKNMLVLLSKYANPDEALGAPFDMTGLATALRVRTADGARKQLKLLGPENFAAVKRWGQLADRLTADPAKTRMWSQIMQWSKGVGLAGAAGLGAVSAAGLSTASPYAMIAGATAGGIGAVLLTRRMIQSSGLLRIAEKFAGSTTSKALTVNAGRLALTLAMVQHDHEQAMATQPADQPSPSPSALPPLPSATPGPQRVPAP